MTVNVIFSPTPTPLPAVPRRVRGLFQEGWGVWFSRVFTLPHVCIGVGMLIFLVVTLLYALFARETMGVATAITRHEGDEGAISYRVDYVYKVAGQGEVKGRSSLKEERVRLIGLNPNEAREGPAPAEGVEARGGINHPVKVRHVTLGGWHYARLPEGESIWRLVGIALLVTLFWNGILSVFVAELWVKPVRNYWLVRRGEATVGTITETTKREDSDGDANYSVAYRYEVAATREVFTRKMNVSSNDFEKTVVGGLVTVIYSARRPGWSLVYEFCGLKVRGEFAEDVFGEGGAA